MLTRSSELILYTNTDLRSGHLRPSPTTPVAMMVVLTAERPRSCSLQRLEICLFQTSPVECLLIAASLTSSRHRGRVYRIPPVIPKNVPSG